MGTKMFKLLFADLKFIAMFKSDNVNWLTLIKSSLSPSFICTFIYRLAHFFHCLSVPLLPRIIWWLNFILFKVDIDQRAKLYGALYFPHPMMIVIGCSVQLNGSAKIMQGVTLGGNLGKSVITAGGSKIDQPEINGRCFIGINSCVVGPIVISGQVFIASSALTSKDAKDTIIFGNNKYRELLDEHKKELL